MGVISRLIRLCRADLHGVMDQLEDKGLLLRQHLREMEGSLKHKEAQIEKIAWDCIRIQRELDRRQQEIRDLAQDLEMALRKDKDDIARALIRKRRALQGAVDQLRIQFDTLDENRNNLGQMLARQRLIYDRLKVDAAGFLRNADQRNFDSSASSMDDILSFQATTEEEVELELLQLKESLHQGGDV